MNLRDLFYFETVAETGHVGRAAAKVHRSQPALTKSIQRLEAEFGAILFDRVGRRLKLTQVGELLLVRARLLRRNYEEAVRAVSEFRQGAVGHIRVGSAATPAEYLLPQLTNALRRDFPGVTMEVVIAMNDLLLPELRAGRLDFVIGPIPDAGSDLAAYAIVQDKVVVVASSAHPLFTRPRLRSKDLCAYRWVLPTATGATRQWLERAFERQHLPKPEIQIESNWIALLPRLIARTNLLSFTSRRALGAPSRTNPLRELTLRGMTMRRKIGLIYRADGYLSPAAQCVRRLVEDHGKEMFLGDYNAPSQGSNSPA